MPKARKAKAATSGTAPLGFEANLWQAANRLRNNMHAAECKQVA